MQCSKSTVAVEMRVTSHPPHRAVCVAFPRTVPTLRIYGQLYAAVCEPAAVTRLCGA